MIIKLINYTLSNSNIIIYKVRIVNKKNLLYCNNLLSLLICFQNNNTLLMMPLHNHLLKILINFINQMKSL